MADTMLQEALVVEQAKMGTRHQAMRWTQPCMRQAARKEPKKWPRSGAGPQPKMPKSQNSPENAARERSRVRNLRQAFQSLQAALPSVPPDTKLSKLDVLVLATNYIAHLTETLDQGGAMVCEHPVLHKAEGYLHPVKKWPMRSLLYCGNIGDRLTGTNSKSVDCHPPSSVAEVKGDSISGLLGAAHAESLLNLCHVLATLPDLGRTDRNESGGGTMEECTIDILDHRNLHRRLLFYPVVQETCVHDWRNRVFLRTAVNYYYFFDCAIYKDHQIN